MAPEVSNAEPMVNTQPCHEVGVAPYPDVFGLNQRGRGMRHIETLSAAFTSFDIAGGSVARNEVRASRDAAISLSVASS
jgi:hypothetical protein